MKSTPRDHLPRLVALVLLGVILLLLASRPAAAAERVGTYDSRLVAFAAFWEEGSQARLKAKMEAAHSAKAAGDFARYGALARELSSLQATLHLQVFSTAPADDVINGLLERHPALRQELGVSRLVSQWDDRALAAVPAEDRVDVTDRLVAEFQVPAARRQQFEQMKAVKPLPLWRARLMSWLHLF